MASRRIRIIALGLVVLFLTGTAAALAGGEGKDKLQTGEQVVLREDQVVAHDLYAFAGTVQVDGTVEGDLVVGAGMVTINGLVEGDLIAGTGQVFINGEVTGDVRAGTGTLVLAGTVGEDLMAGAGRIDVTESGTVGEDLFFAAGEVRVDGTVDGNVVGTASRYTRNGTVGGTEDVIIEPEPEPPVAPGFPRPDQLPTLIGDAVRQWVSVILLGGLGLLLAPRAVRASGSALRRRPLASAGLGIGVLVGSLIGVIAVLLLAILLAILLGSVTLDGLAGFTIWGGILSILVWTFVLILAMAYLVDAVVGVAIGQMVERGWSKSRWHELALLIGGSFLVVLVTNLPFIGPVAKLVVIVLGLGAMAVAIGEWWSRGHPPTPVAFPAAAPTWPVAQPATPPAETPPPAAAAPPAAPAPPATAPAQAPAAKPRATRTRKPKPPEPPAEPSS
jgi:cytoskeletal protein CcmA (bactofilin family)